MPLILSRALNDVTSQTQQKTGHSIVQFRQKILTRLLAEKLYSPMKNQTPGDPSTTIRNDCS